uniref:Uncharacterized protein n=1 Tax=Ditylenchus dipsaci TaxID=166011 RepID=A0A915EKJ7_9BILA
MFGQKYRQQAQKPKESSPAGSNTFNSSCNFFCYADQTKGKTYFIYWNAEASTLGVSNLADSVYETILEKKERKRVLKNVADTFVDAKWKSIFAMRSLKLGNITESSLTLKYVLESVHLSKVLDQDAIHSKNVELLKNALDETLLKAASAKENQSPEVSEYGLKRHEKTMKASDPQSTPLKLVDRNRRKRAKPTGLVFEDDDNESNEENT